MPKPLTLDAYITHTTVQDGDIWHPGIKHGLRVLYYPNDKFNTEEAAAICAQEMVEQVTISVNESFGLTTDTVKELT